MIIISYICILICALTGTGLSQNPELDTTSGVVIGTTHSESHAFYGVRYGQAPDGEYRFEPPRPATYSTEKSNASVPTFLRCWENWQSFNQENEFNSNYSEDCLFLDINVPSSVDLSAEVEPVLPVMFWIHGGAFSFGSGTDPKFDGRYLANNTNTIVVAINYRLDALGCLVYEDEEVSFSGNQGIKDQQLALKWVYDNIENFGGNKSKITIFGESADGQSVTMHLMSSTSRRFFKQAIIQSYRAAIDYETKDEAKAKTQALLAYLNCGEDKLHCLRNATAKELMQAHDFVAENSSVTFFDRTQPYRPILDGAEFADPPLKYFQFAKLDSDLKVIIGTTSDEAASIKVEFENETMTKDKFIEQNIYYAGPYYGPFAAEKYMENIDNPDDPDFDFTDILAQEVADMMFVCPNRALARFLEDAIDYTLSPTNFAVYHYVFDDPVDALNCEEILGVEGLTMCKYASHAAELYYVFNSGPSTGLKLTDKAQSLADMMNELWGNFSHQGEPTKDALFWHGYIEVLFWDDGRIVIWPSLNITAAGSNQIQEYRSDMCDYWDNLGFYFNFTSSIQAPEITSSTQAPDEMTTSGFVSVSICFSIALFLSFLVLLRVFE